jgi:hypothetical protein
MVAGPVPLLPRGVAVVRRRAQLRNVERQQVAKLVLRECLRWRDVEDGRAALAVAGSSGDHRGQCGQQVGQGLAGGGSRGHDHMLSRVGCLSGRRLVRPRRPDAAGHPGFHQLGGRPLRPLGVLPGSWREDLQVREPVLATGRSGQPVHKIRNRDGDTLGHSRSVANAQSRC